MVKNKLKIVLLVVGSLVSATALFKVINQYRWAEGINSDVVGAFIEWKEKEDKRYNSPEELQYRLGIFASNLRDITIGNERESGYELGLNSFSDLTKKEFKAKYLTSPKAPLGPQGGITKIFSQNGEESVKKYWDWTVYNKVPLAKIKDSCSSSYSISAITSVESAYLISGVYPGVLSSQEIIDCSISYGNSGCEGGWPFNSIKYIAENGISLATSYPYIDKENLSCKASGSKRKIYIKDFFTVAKFDEEQMKLAVLTQPVVVSLDMSWAQNYKKGVYSGECRVDNFNQNVLVIGFGEDNGRLYWKCQASWGGSWGEKGSFRIYRVEGKTNQPCGMLEYGVFPVI